MSQYASKEVSAAVTRKATPNESWLEDQLDRINPERREMGSAGDTPALTTLVFELRRENQRLQGEAKVMCDLMRLSIPPIESMLPEVDHPSGEYEALSGLKNQIEAALRGAT